MNELEPPVTWFLDDLRVTRGSSPNTVSAYGRDLVRYASFMSARGFAGWDRVSRGDIEEYTQVLAAGDDEHEPLAASSRGRAIASIRGFHRWLVDQRLVEADVASAVKPPRGVEHLPKALSITEVQSLLEAAGTGGDARSLRDAALLEYLYATGARVSEAVDTALDDLDLDAEFPVARLFGKGRKERLVPLGSYARRAIEDYLVRARPVLSARGTGVSSLFLNLRGKPLSRQSAWEIIRLAAQKAGIEAEVSPHTLRHSFATHLLEGGASIREVQELLGHASVTTTQIYTKLTAQNLREVYLTSHPRAL